MQDLSVRVLMSIEQKGRCSDERATQHFSNGRVRISLLEISCTYHISQTSILVVASGTGRDFSMNSQGDGVARLSNRGRYTVFEYGDTRLMIIAPRPLERYL